MVHFDEAGAIVEESHDELSIAIEPKWDLICQPRLAPFRRSGEKGNSD